MAAKKSKWMDANAALKKAVRLFGKNASVREDRGAPTPAERQEAREVMLLNRQTKGVLDPKVVLDAQRTVLRHRCTIGVVSTVIPGFPVNMVKGQGDTWEAAFEKAAESKARGY